MARLHPRMTTGGSTNHARIARNALNALSAAFGSGPCEAFGGDLAVRVADGRVTYPDASVSCGRQSHRDVDAPVVVIEVLSPSTSGYDVGDKAAAYRRMPSLRHHSIVRRDRIGIAHRHRAAPGEDFTLTDVERVDATRPLDAVCAALPVAALYARATFEG